MVSKDSPVFRSTSEEREGSKQTQPDFVVSELSIQGKPQRTAMGEGGRERAGGAGGGGVRGEGGREGIGEGGGGVIIE